MYDEGKNGSRTEKSPRRNVSGEVKLPSMLVPAANQGGGGFGGCQGNDRGWRMDEMWKWRRRVKMNGGL